MSDNTEFYLKTLLQLTARQTFSNEDVARLVCPTAQSTKRLRAYNLCDGTRTLTEIRKLAGLETAQLHELMN